MIDVSNFTDKQLQCPDCGTIFTWTANEQAFYLSKGLAPVKRCKPCRDARRATLIVDSSKGVNYDN